MSVQIITSRLRRSLRAFLLIVSLITPTAAAADDVMSEGLYFNSFTVDKDRRTSLNLTPDKPVALPDGFTLSFDFRLRREKDFFGYLFRIIGDGANNIDLITNPETYELMLVSGKETLLQFDLHELIVKSDTAWINVSLTVRTDSNHVMLNINDKIVEASLRSRPSSAMPERFSFYFGRNSTPDFFTSDVAPFILKDVRIYNDNNRLIRYWKLDKHGEDCVYDECRNEKATVANAVWEIDARSEWRKLTTMIVPGRFPQIAFDDVLKRFFISRQNTVRTYDIQSNDTSSVNVLQGSPFNVEINQMFFDKSGGQLLMYDFEHNYPTRFDPATKTWNNNNDTLTWIRFMHHNKYYDEVNHVVYTFGGYGFHKYSALFQRFTEATQQWESFDLSASIHPRYLAAMGALNDSLLLCFGGYGNASGMQQELPHNYYDLYSINPQTLNVVKLWDKEYVGEHFANSNSLIINRRNRTFYTLSYPQNIYESQLTLHEYSLDEPHVRRLGNPVPYLFHDVASYCDLFMPSDSSALYAVTSHLDGDNSCIEIYSISYPPLSLAETLQTPKEKKSVLYVITVLILSLIVLSAVFWLLRLVAKRKQANAVLKVIETANATEDAAEKSSLPVPYPSLNVLGRFEVFDATGMNITHLFTPTTRQMFFLLYFRSLNEGKGITSNELQKTLWPDRDYDSARNNRNVYFNRLRPLLNYIGNIHLIRTDNSWSLQFDESEIYSDYLRALNSLALLKEQTEPDRELLTATLQIIRSGKLLPLRDFEWLDNYKTHYANIVIETLTHISSSAAIRKDLPLLLNIAEAILLQDDTEEYAIKLKCSILFKIGKKKQALQCYNKFAEEYFALLNAQPDLSFNEMVSE